MNITFNSIIERFNTLEATELSEDTAWKSAIGSALLLGAGLAYAIYKHCMAPQPQNSPAHALTVTYDTDLGFNVLKIHLSGDRDTLPENLKKQFLEQVQNWAGPKGYRFFPSKGIQVLPKSLNNLTVIANGTTAHGSNPLSGLKNDFYLKHLSILDIHGLLTYKINNPQRTYNFEIFADDQSPPEILDGILEDILNLFNIKGR